MDKTASNVLRVLIVEDDATRRKAIRHVVNSGLNAHCAAAKDGQEAWDILLANTFDIVISDWNMPRKSGDALLAGAGQNIRRLLAALLFFLFGWRENQEFLPSLGLSVAKR